MNNPLLRLGMAVAVLVGVVWFAFSSYSNKTTEYEHKLDLERIRREYLERAPLARSLTDPARYKVEMQQMFRWYFGELDEHYSHFNEYKNYERFTSELADRKKSGKVSNHDIAQYEERYQATHAFWELLRSGKYDPIFTLNDKGLRFDIYKIEALNNLKEPHVRFYFALYGAQRRFYSETNTGIKTTRLAVNAAFHQLVFSGLSAEGKPIREMQASGDPFKVDHPERFIEEFPPDIVFGYYELPKIPAEVASAEITFDISTRSVFTGEEMAGQFVWKVPVEADWKLPIGATWEGAQEQER